MMESKYARPTKRGKYSFVLLSFLLLAFFVSVSWNAPVSGDEYVHFKQAEKNILYFKTLGKDKTALETPVSRLKYYGQSFDNLTTWLIETLHVNNVIRFRHVSNALAGWLLVLFSGLLAVWINRDFRAGIITILLLAVSPRFTGHLLNNLKDIPFALGYTASVYFIFRYLENLKRPITWIIGGLVASMAFTISIRIGGVLVLCYLLLFWGLRIYEASLSGLFPVGLKKYLIKACFIFIAITVLSWFLGMVFWPWGWEDPIYHPFQALVQIHHYPTTLRQLFEGKLYWSDMFPWYYLPKFILITVPIVVFAGLLLYIIRLGKVLRTDRFIFHIFLAISVGFPLVYIVLTGANVYGGWRQLLFVYPPMVIMAATGIFSVVKNINVLWRWFMVMVLVLLLFLPVKFMISNHPYYYTYFNSLAGSTKNAFGNYELDYYFTGYKEAYEWINKHVKDEPDKIRVATNFLIPWYYQDSHSNMIPVYFDYYMRGNYDWDYAVVPGTFLSPYQLKEHIWPPQNTVYQVRVSGMPVCAVIERKQNDDLKGFSLLQKRRYDEAEISFLKALKQEPRNETALLNLARVFFYKQDYQDSGETLGRLLDIYPGYEWAIDLLGEIRFEQGDVAGAVKLWKNNIDSNYKFYHSYINLSRAYMKMGMDDKALSILFSCLRINPFYKPALMATGKWYTEHGEEDMAEKYFEKVSNHD